MGSSDRLFACTPRRRSRRRRVPVRNAPAGGGNASRGGYRTALCSRRAHERSGTLARPMRPIRFRSLVVGAVTVALLAFAASGVFASGDLSACTLVANAGITQNPVGTILEAVDATGGRAWAVGGHVVGPVSSPFIQWWDGKAWRAQHVEVPPGPIGMSSFYAVKAFSTSDVWAVGSWMGDDPLVEHWDGHRWSLVTVPSPGGTENVLTGIAGTTSTDLWLLRQRATAAGTGGAASPPRRRGCRRPGRTEGFHRCPLFGFSDRRKIFSRDRCGIGDRGRLA